MSIITNGGIPTIAAQIIGSVGVRQADTARHDTNVKLGKSAFIIPNE
jgi:hypothetical protein